MKTSLAALIVLAVLTGCASPRAHSATSAADAPAPTCTCKLAKLRAAAGPHWVTTWASAPQLIDSTAPAPALAQATLRQIVRVSLGGNRLRVRFSNEFGNGPLIIAGAHLAVATLDSGVVPASDRELRFSGQAGVTIAAGEAVWSDAVDLHVAPLGDVAVSVALADVPAALTAHLPARTAGYLKAGNTTGAAKLDGATELDATYFLTAVDVLASPVSQALVVLGDSISDGGHAGDRWTDFLARRLQAQAATASVAVVNQAMDGNALVLRGQGPTAMRRFGRDVLEQSGVRWLIIQAGMNDIAGAEGDVSSSVVAAYQDLVARAHARNIAVYGVPVLPFGGAVIHTAAHEAARQKVNAWIRTRGNLDGVIDLEAVVASPDEPARLAPEWDSGDHLHPTPAAHRKMADAVDLTLFAH